MMNLSIFGEMVGILEFTKATLIKHVHDADEIVSKPLRGLFYCSPRLYLLLDCSGIVYSGYNFTIGQKRNGR